MIRGREVGLWGGMALLLFVGCGTGGSAPGGSGSGSSSGSSSPSGSSTGASGTSGSSSGSSGGSGASGTSEAPPSCAAGGPGLSDCGPSQESCCASSLVASGTFDRTYGVESADGGPTDPAAVSAYRLDKYDVTVGRFRQFVKVVLSSDGGAAWVPAAGSGKHAHLNGGRGLVDDGSTDAGTAYEPGWATSDDSNVSPTGSNLSSCAPFSTWTPSTGAEEHLPINCVNWAEAYAFCIWDGGFLPSEAEWEYGAAGGSQQRAYPWGATDPGTANQYAIFNCQYPNGSTNCTDVSSIAPVGTAPSGAGAWGQLDLAGNMWQWNADFYAPFVDPCTDCGRLTSGSSRILRGGSFRDAPPNLFPAYRNANDPGLRNDFVGFRCARSPL